LLLQKRASGLDESEQLRLEEHLSQCEACDGESRALAALRDLALQAGSPLDDRARERAIQRAFDGGPRRLPDAERRPLPLLAAAAALALAATTALFALLPKDGSSPAGLLAFLDGEPIGERVLAGEIWESGRAIPAGGEVRSGAVLRSERGARIDLGSAVLELATDTRIRWLKESSTVNLQAGVVRAEVETGNRFQVATDRFLVIVAGTRFEVSRQGVEVHEGRVRVLSREGDLLIAALGPGQSWKREPVATAESETGQRSFGSLDDTGRQPPPSGRALLELARRHLSGGKTDAARRAVKAALGGKLSRAQRAEADTLLAECSLVAGDRATAARRYLQVASRYPELAAAENALFAAARLRVENGQRTEALALLRRYIEKYPNGRFETEVTRRLRALER
jgi:TolA-binding protein